MRRKETPSPLVPSLLDGTILAGEKVARWHVVASVIAIFVFTILLRSLLLTSAPVGALIDEAHFGYIAYSLLQTGKDEHGISWPLIFKGFGDQKLPLYGYSLLPVVKWWGLSNATIRYPSLLAGAVIVVSIYGIIKKLFNSHLLAVCLAVMTILAPWSFFLSRFGFESNLGLAFFCVGIWAMITSLSDARWRWPIIAALCWALTWYSYIAFRPVTVILGLVFYGYQAWQTKSWQKLAVFLIPLLIFVAPLVLTKAASSNTARFNQVGILSDVGMAQTINEQRTFCAVRAPRLICDIFWNKPFYIGGELLRRYLGVFSPQYMATVGEEIVFLNVKGFGQLYVTMYPLLLLGVLALVIRRKDFPISTELRVFLLAGLLLTPIPTILVGDAQKVRISPLLPFVFIAISVGLVYLLKLLKNVWLQKIVLLTVMISVVGLSMFYLLNFFTYHMVKNDYDYQSYVPEMMRFLQQTDQKNQVIIKPFFSDPLMFYAYYTRMDPAQYQRQAVLGELEPSGFQHTVQLGRFKVKDDSLANIACQAAATDTPTIFVSNIKEPGAEPIKQLRSQNGALVYATIYDALTIGKHSSCQK